MNADNISINESHLIGQNEITVNGYKWIGFNRKGLHIRAQKGSGGIGFLLKKLNAEEYEIETVDRSYDGI